MQKKPKTIGPKTLRALDIWKQISQIWGLIKKRPKV